jgi:hypothetical protein
MDGAASPRAGQSGARDNAEWLAFVRVKAVSRRLSRHCRQGGREGTTDMALSIS